MPNLDSGLREIKPGDLDIMICSTECIGFRGTAQDPKCFCTPDWKPVTLGIKCPYRITRFEAIPIKPVSSKNLPPTLYSTGDPEIFDALARLPEPTNQELLACVHYPLMENHL